MWAPVLQQHLNFAEPTTARLDLHAQAAAAAKVGLELRVLDCRTGLEVPRITPTSAVVHFDNHSAGYTLLVAAHTHVKTEAALPWRLRILSMRDFPSFDPRDALPQHKSVLVPLADKDSQSFR